MMLGLTSFCLVLIFLNAIFVNVIWDRIYGGGDSRNPALLFGFAPVNYLALFYSIRCLLALKRIDPNAPKGLVFDFTVGALTAPGFIPGIPTVLASPFIIPLYTGNIF